MLIGEQLTAASHAALHLVQHQQRLMLIAQRAQTLHKLCRRGHHAALALNRLDHDGAGMVVDNRFYRLEIVKGNVHDIRRFRPEAVGVFRLAADGNGKQRAPVKRVVEGDDFTFERAVALAGVVARQLESGLVRFRAGVGEEDAIGEGGVDKLAGKAQRRLVGKDVAQMPQGFALGFQRLDQRRMTVAQRRDGDAAGEVDILFALLIPDAAALAFDRHKLRRCINRQNDVIERFPRYRNFLRCHRRPPLIIY